MTELPEDEAHELTVYFSDMFKKAGLEVPATLPQEIANIFQTARRAEIHKILESHFAAKFKFGQHT